MKCIHGKDEREECQACASQWKAEEREPYWRKTAGCSHRTLPTAWGTTEPMATTLVDDNTGRVLAGACEHGCKTALSAPARRR